MRVRSKDLAAYIKYIGHKVTDWYREGLGWVWEPNRQKVRGAQDELDAFYRQDTIDDLNNAKEAELNNLEERIRNWDNYLQMLQTKYDEYNRLQEQQLLMELLEVESQEEVEARIKADMLDFTQFMDEHMGAFFDNQIKAFQAFNGEFSEFLDAYEQNLERKRALETADLNFISADDYNEQNDEYLDTKTPEIIKKKDTNQTLWEIVTNDKAVVKNDKVLKDSKGYVDYTAAMNANIQSGDVYQAAYDMALRYVKSQGLTDLYNTGKLDEKTYKDYLPYIKEATDEATVKALIQGWKDSGLITGEEVKSFENTYHNAQMMELAINSRNENLNQDMLEIESEMSQVAIAFATYLPQSLDEQQASQLMSDLENTLKLSEAIDGVGLSTTDSATLITERLGEKEDKIIQMLQDKFDLDKKQAEAIAKQASSSYSGGGGGGSSSTSNWDSSDNYNHAYSGQTDYSNVWDDYLAGKATQADVDAAHMAKAAELAEASGWTGSVADFEASHFDSASGAWSFAKGIEGGAVTYTGLAMLHGTPSKPEYVLNNDQAYNLLRYLSTKAPEYTSTASTSCDTNYYLSGDIVLENCDDPAEFWNQVTQAMDRKYSVSKNRK